MTGRSLSIAFVLPYGQPLDAFFPDTFLGMLAASADAQGHAAKMVRAYYHGADSEADAAIVDRLVAWLDHHGTDLIVFERIIDTLAVDRHRLAHPDVRTLVMVRGDSLDPIPGIDFAIGAIPSVSRRSAARTPTTEELVAAFDGFVRALAEGGNVLEVAGVARMTPAGYRGTPLPGPPNEWPELPLPLDAMDVIAPGDDPAVIRKTLLGNSGCPYGGDVFEALELAPPGDDEVVAGQGCAFCFMGGDYQKRSDDEVLASLVRQAVHATRDPAIEELVLSDQYPYRYLARLMHEAAEAGVRPGVRWLFAARCDAFVRSREIVRGAIEAAGAAGYVLELYLSGFESFSDADLERFHKGVTVEEEVAAVEQMRALAAEFAGAFEYRRARGHSLILWHPWTTPESLLDNVTTMRRHGLVELFDEPTRNRMRLYDLLPITRAARRDGALVETWEQGDHGSGSTKGYNPEQPWRFIDARARVAWQLCEAIRPVLGTVTELSWFGAVAAFTASLDPVRLPAIDRVLDGLERLRVTSAELSRGRPDGPTRARSERTAVVRFAGGCNNGCAGCTNRDIYLADTPEVLADRVRAAREAGRPVVLTGREPTIHPAFFDLVAQAAGDDRRRVGVVTNGRAFYYASYARRAFVAGLRSVSVKLFGPDSGSADVYTRSAGGFLQAVAGLKHLAALPGMAVEVRVPLHTAILGRGPAIVDEVATLGVAQLRVDLPIDAIGLDRAAEAADTLEAIAVRCEQRRIALRVTPLESGTASEEWVNA